MYKVPDNLLYSKEHEWVKLINDIAVVGITDYAQKELGDIVFVEMPNIGQKVEFSKVCGSIESVKSVSDIYSPVNGEVIEVNTKLIDKPELLNEDPYTNYIFKVRITDFSFKDKLLDANQYKQHIGIS